jgi:hypothetical protein
MQQDKNVHVGYSHKVVLLAELSGELGYHRPAAYSGLNPLRT